MIDFHCHIDLYPKPSLIIDKAISEGVYVLAVTTTPRAWAGTKLLTSHAPRIRVGLGLHPELVEERHSEVEMLCSNLKDAKYVGEIGLDGSPRHKHNLLLQQSVLNRILDACEQTGGRIMTIHSRSAATQVLDALEAHPDAGVPVLHWFSGNLQEAKRAVNMGCWFSVGMPMFQSIKGISLVRAIPPSRILTETDGPFTKSNNESLFPWDVKEVIVQLSKLWNISFSEADGIINSNLKKLLNENSDVLATN